MKYLIFIAFISFPILLLSQENELDTKEEPLNYSVTIKEEIPDEVFRTYFWPKFSDSTMLFFNDSIIWTCSENFNDIISDCQFANCDFRKIENCIGSSENYIKKKNSVFSIPQYQLENSEIHATLTRIAENSFLYSELDKEGNEIRIDTILFNYDNVIATDSSSTYDFESDVYITNITKLFKVEKN